FCSEVVDDVDAEAVLGIVLAIVEHVFVAVIDAQLGTKNQVLAPPILGERMDRKPQRRFVEVGGYANARPVVVAQPLETTGGAEVVVELIRCVASDAIPLGIIAIGRCAGFPAIIGVNREAPFVVGGIGEDAIDNHAPVPVFSRAFRAGDE